jgi:site-specific DNA-cytosine methylase
LRGYLETGNKKRKGVAADAGAGAQAGRKWPADLACTLNASFGDKQGLEDQHALGGGSLFVPAPICMSSGQANAAIAEDKAHTLNATHETQTIVTPYTASSFAQYAEGVGTVRASGGDLGGGSETLLTEPVHFDTYNQTTSNISFTLSCSASDANHTGTVFVPNMAVRRLTPVECERLQGFPDNWSRISWKGKPEEECPDGPRYKACGNSMAVPVMAFIGRQIAAVDSTLSHA